MIGVRWTTADEHSLALATWVKRHVKMYALRNTCSSLSSISHLEIHLKTMADTHKASCSTSLVTPFLWKQKDIAADHDIGIYLLSSRKLNRRLQSAHCPAVIFVFPEGVQLSVGRQRLSFFTWLWKAALPQAFFNTWSCYFTILLNFLISILSYLFRLQ